MRSLAERAREALEWLLRIAALAILVWFLVRTILVQRHGAVEDATSASVSAKLARWSTVAAPSRVHVRIEHPPAGRDRDWLAALSGASTDVDWSGPSLVPTAISVEPRIDPAGGADVNVASPENSVTVLADTLGVLDSARATRTGVRGYVPKFRGTVDAMVGPVVARAARHDSIELHKLLVIGQAGWEAKFAVAALEERGWQVDAHIVVSPKGDVRQGKIVDIDTAHYSAVIAIDSTAARYGDRIAAFVKQGGGLVLWSPAARVRSLAAIAPGAAGALIADEGDAVSDSAPRSGLELVPITPLNPDAIVIERRGNNVALAARRVGRGRVLETGYTNSWRWRMAGGAEALARHREWMAGLVALVATSGHRAVAAAPSDVAPLVTLIDELGPSKASSESATLDPAAVARWVFALVCAALLLEWASRRVRGVK
jgi:hypothetical protein